MPRLPVLAGAPSQQILTDTFAGYNHNLKIVDGEFYNTENLSTEMFPMLANRRKRGTLTGVGGTDFQDLQAIVKRDALFWIADGVLYKNGIDTGLHGLKDEPDPEDPNKKQRERQIVNMGAYICIFPDKVYYNTIKDGDYGSMEATYSYTGAVSYHMCHQDGTIYSRVSKSSAEPGNPQNGDVWIDTVDGSVKQWSAYTTSWTVIETVYTRVGFTGQGNITRFFKEHDGVEISGMYDDDLNGSKILYAVGGEDSVENDYIVIIGIQEEPHEEVSETITISRNVPDMDFVCEAQNRLWGCYYGNIPGVGNINEVYCCALGDFKNWSQYLGVSTDSWRASIGSDGVWTGCINYFGSPTFFKENRIHQIGVSSVGAHQVSDLPARGVQEGSHRSLAIVNETLYYKSRSGVVAWQGGMPADVGAALGDVKYYEAAAGVFGQRYYVSMRDSANVWNFFCFDVKTGLWMREDNLHAEGFTAWGDELYVKSGDSIVTINGTEGTLENKVEWFAETGVMHYEYTDHKYVSRYNLRLKMEKDARLQLFIEYDSSGIWEFSGEVRVHRIDSFVIPVRPRRCDHLRLKIVGEGDVRIFSMARVLESGSDV